MQKHFNTINIFIFILFFLFFIHVELDVINKICEQTVFSIDNFILENQKIELVQCVDNFIRKVKRK